MMAILVVAIAHAYSTWLMYRYYCRELACNGWIVMIHTRIHVLIVGMIVAIDSCHT